MSMTKLFTCLALSFAAGPLLAQAMQAPGAAVDAARSSASRDDNQRGTGPSRDAGGSPFKSMTIEGGGISLPKGLALTVAACSCAGLETKGCVEPDPVACRTHQGTLERASDMARPSDIRLKGTGVEVPRCFGESRESVDCPK